MHSVLLCGLPHEHCHVFFEMVPYVCGDEEDVDHGSHGEHLVEHGEQSVDQLELQADTKT